MSGAESLIPFLKEKGKNNQPIIIVDSREAQTAPKIIKGLKEKGAEISIRYLEKGDYVISNQCAFERKTVNDFVYSLTRRFLFDQLFTLQECYEKPFILIEGYLPIVYKYSKIQPTSVWGAMFAIAKQGINLMHTNSYKETVDFLYTAAKQEQIVEKRSPVIHPVKKTESLAESQIFFMASLPNIGREKAVSILNTYQCPLNALNNVDRWQNDVNGLGPKITKKVKEVIHETYTDTEKTKER
ncbi:MAG: ERCC4 domain-containing protein [Candidatus Bathyarchaeota archaeon]|nr:ERCC4 domain-containing protein [Candidatus Bathyarchaeum tardum]WGM88460.1 MAG: ERCC4 domain-containing protein [Candidatus Bathyarchaeum tardum]